MNHHPIIRWVMHLVGIGLVLLSLQAVGQALAQDHAPTTPVGNAFTYQGLLKDSDGTPVDNTCDLRFQLYDAETLGSQVGPIQDLTGVRVINGYFTVQMNFGKEAFNGDARWLQVSVKCGGDLIFTVLTPRQSITAAPYAINADTLDGQHAAAFAGVSHDHWGESWTGSGVGLTLSGGAGGFSGSGSTYGVYGASDSTLGKGVYGYASASSGVSIGVHGESKSTAGRGVYGYVSTTEGETYGVWGEVNSASGTGVYGYAADTTGVGITRGVRGLNLSPNGYGVYGSSENQSGTGVGVYGRSNGTDGFGVVGIGSYASVGVAAWSRDGNLIEAYDGAYLSGYLRFYIDQAGNVYANSYNPLTTSSLDGATHALSTLQSTEVWLEDFGRAGLVDGVAVVHIVPDFSGVADLTADYLVFITLEGDCQGVYITNKTSASFEVRETNGGKSSIPFGYRIVARPAGAETGRLPVVDIPNTVETTRMPSESVQMPEGLQP